LRRAALIATTIALLAPSSAAAQTPHVVATANGATARSSANEGEVLSCGASGCESAITAPARPPATWDGELPVSTGSVIELTFGRPVELLGARVVLRDLTGGGSATVERIDDQHWRVTVSSTVPDPAALELLERWEGDDSRGHYTVHRTDYMGLELAAAAGGVKQPHRGGGTVVSLDARAGGLVDARLSFGKKTLGQKSTTLATPRSLSLSVPLSRAARRLLAKRRVLDAKLTLTVRPPSGDPVALVRPVRLRAKPR
jgi:hypothetical protein